MYAEELACNLLFDIWDYLRGVEVNIFSFSWSGELFSLCKELLGFSVAFTCDVSGRVVMAAISTCVLGVLGFARVFYSTVGFKKEANVILDYGFWMQNSI